MCAARLMGTLTQVELRALYAHPYCVWWWRRLAGSGRQGGGGGGVRGRIGSRGVRARRRRRRADAALSRLSLAELVPSAQCARTERDGEKFLIGKWKKKET